MSDFRMPQLGADMAAATLTEWLAKPGDKVTRGDIIAVVETEKGAIEIEIFEDGEVDRLLVEPGAKVPVGTVLAKIVGDRDDAAAGPAATAPPSPAPAAPASGIPAPAVAPSPEMQPRASGGRVRISPAAARLASEHGVDIRVLSGTGPGGAIRIADVEKAMRGLRPTDVPAGTAEPVRDMPGDMPGDLPGDTPEAAMRRAIAAAMGRSKREIPHYYLSAQIDMTRALDWVEEINRNRPVTDRLIYSVLLIKAVALALEDFPEFNGFWDGNAFRPAEEIHIGWAISLRGGGLVSPALHNAGKLDLDPLMSALRDLVRRARAFRLRGSELSDPTITVTNLGDRGVEIVFGVIYPPQVALVGFGKLVERPWVVDGATAPRRIIHTSLAADHRVSDGHRGGLFLNRIDRLLQEPEKL